MASLWVTPGAATKGVTPVFFPKNLATFFSRQFCGVTTLLKNWRPFFAHQCHFLLISLGCYPPPWIVLPRTFFYMSDLVSPLFCVNLPTIFFLRVSPPGGCHPGRFGPLRSSTSVNFSKQLTILCTCLSLCLTPWFAKLKMRPFLHWLPFLQGKVATFWWYVANIFTSSWKFSKLSNSVISLNWSIIRLHLHPVKVPTRQSSNRIASNIAIFIYYWDRT